MIQTSHLEYLLPVLKTEGITERIRAKSGNSYQQKIEGFSLESRRLFLIERPQMILILTQRFDWRGLIRGGRQACRP